MLEKLINAAKEEDWDFVDGNIPKITEDESYVNWAYSGGIYDPNDNVRDLAVSILQKAKIPEPKFVQVMEDLTQLMKSDKNPYVRYRSAFTLWENNIKNNLVKSVILEAKKDPDTSEIAERYLKE